MKQSTWRLMKVVAIALGLSALACASASNSVVDRALNRASNRVGDQVGDAVERDRHVVGQLQVGLHPRTDPEVHVVVERRALAERPLSLRQPRQHPAPCQDQRHDIVDDEVGLLEREDAGGQIDRVARIAVGQAVGRGQWAGHRRRRHFGEDLGHLRRDLAGVASILCLVVAVSGIRHLVTAGVALVAGGGPTARRGAMRYLVVAVAGSLLFLLGVGLVYGQTGTLDVLQAGARLQDGPEVLVALTAVVAGMAMKTALFPAHGWLPPAHSAAPPAVSPILSALVVKASFYVLVRLWFDVFGRHVPEGAGLVLGVLGTLAVAWGAALALRQTHLKRVVAYSTVAQLGYLFLLFPLATPALAGNAQDAETARLAWLGVFGLLMAHGVAKSAMFLAAGTLAAGYGTDELGTLRGAVAAMPVPMFAFGMAGVSLAGLPPTFGFLGKWNLLQASLGSGQWWWLLVLMGGGLGTAAYTARVLRLTYSGPDDDVELPELNPVRRRTQVVPLLLAVLAVGLGLGSGQLLELSLIGVGGDP